MMRNKYERSLSLRLISSIAALTFIFTLIYVFIVGVNLFSAVLLVSTVGGLAGQAIYFSESMIECVVGFFEILLESITSIFEAIASLFSL